MIRVKENTEYEVGFEISKVAGNLRWIRDRLDEPRVNIKDILEKVDATLDMLKKIHNWMAEG